MSKVTSFEPIVDSATRVLVLGSMPGVKSLNDQKYYANPKNQFWKIIYCLFDVPLEKDYAKRLRFLKEKGIGLWDVLDSCDRSGSLDSHIKNEKVNDFETLFKTYSNIKAVVFNGTKAYEAFRKNIGFDRFGSIAFRKLPSTSPAHTVPFDQKLKEWKTIAEYLFPIGGKNN